MYAWWFWTLLVSVTFHSLSGRTCREDVDECLSQPCFPAVSCSNTLGSFICGSCPPGFTGDGKMCQGTHNVNVSLAKHDQFLAYCSELCALTEENIAGSPVRAPQVSQRAKPSGPSPCSRAPCYTGVLCFESIHVSAGFACGPCPPGFQGNGQMCTKMGEILSSLI